MTEFSANAAELNNRSDGEELVHANRADAHIT